MLALGRGAVGPGFGVDVPLELLLDAIVAHGGGRVQPIGDVGLAELGDKSGPSGVVGPDAGEAVGL